MLVDREVWQLRFVQAGLMRFQVAQAGPEDGPLVLLLHGFPEFWYSWRHQLGPLAEAGFRVWAPDQRGYNRTDKPRDLDEYEINHLVDDVQRLIEAAGHTRAAVIGHDWGGIVAWWLAATNPDRVERLGIINAPHPLAFRRYLSSSPRQMLRSWYALAAQVPMLPEAANWATGGRLMEMALQRTSRPGTFHEEDLARYREAWAQPGAVSSMVNWYRAFARGRLPVPTQAAIRPPTLILWGQQDVSLAPELAHLSLQLCANGRLHVFDDATHWLHQEQPQEVNSRLINFLQAPLAPNT